MSRWSLRTKLVAVTALALLPVAAISGWRAFDDARQAQVRHAEAASAVSGLADSRYRELMEGSRRLLLAACSDDAVQRALGQVVGIHQKLVPGLALHQPRRVVHPGVVVAEMAPADQEEPAVQFVE